MMPPPHWIGWASGRPYEQDLGLMIALFFYKAICAQSELNLRYQHLKGNGLSLQILGLRQRLRVRHTSSMSLVTLNASKIRPPKSSFAWAYISSADEFAGNFFSAEYLSRSGTSCFIKFFVPFYI
ncbi:hypothetical protein THAOC_22099 [Thalassiosira oceanica]|uniref:Uncharacterized protein n=1 Tax=Thalassiosira oceanica TaxID=159749 RepID=K0RVH9_THAOC|nr:hypothetical protein THAOC_22099 [Thalassiosira oceanica]|eukprot:EJK57818.1 hypothetical protein THAOC_22099 [Thalassiosira oceanica]